MGWWCGGVKRRKENLVALATHFRDLRVWNNAVDLAMEVFELSKVFPSDEKYSLTDQMRRSTRAVAANITEAWRKRRYVAAFASRLNDAETEAGESQLWLEICLRCGYLSRDVVAALDQRYEELLAQLSVMIRDADTWCAGFQSK
jgi:four helix bundle protein